MALQKPVVVLLDTDKVAGRAEKLYLDAVGDSLCATLVAVWVGHRSLAGGIVRSTNITEGTEPLVRALAGPAKGADLRLTVHTEVNLTKGTIEGHFTVAALADRVVGEAVLAVVKERSPEDADRGPEEGHRPDRRRHEKQEYEDLHGVRSIM